MIRAAAAVLVGSFLSVAPVGQQPGTGQPVPPGPGGTQPQLPAGHPQVPPQVTPGPGAADWPAAQPEDVASLDGIIKAYYASTSGPKGQAREWDRYRSLFAPDSRLIVARPGPGGGAAAMFLSVNDFVEANKRYFEKGGFFDKEIARRTETYGTIAHVWSTYESRHSESEAQAYSRGISSIQLLKSGDRWYILNVFWEAEQPDVAFPEKYLSNPKE
jgi:hypothetical protein